MRSPKDEQLPLTASSKRLALHVSGVVAKEIPHDPTSLPLDALTIRDDVTSEIRISHSKKDDEADWRGLLRYRGSSSYRASRSVLSEARYSPTAPPGYLNTGSPKKVGACVCDATTFAQAWAAWVDEPRAEKHPTIPKHFYVPHATKANTTFFPSILHCISSLLIPFQ